MAYYVQDVECMRWRVLDLVGDREANYEIVARSIYDRCLVETMEASTRIIGTPHGECFNHAIFLLKNEPASRRAHRLALARRRDQIINRKSHEALALPAKMVSRPSGTILNQPEVYLLCASPTSVACDHEHFNRLDQVDDTKGEIVPLFRL